MIDYMKVSIILLFMYKIGKNHKNRKKLKIKR